MSSKKQRYLYLPIETWAREFHAKALLGVQAVRHGWSVVLGPKTAMDRNLEYLYPGTVFQFGLHKNFVPAMRRLRTLGHKVVVVDEEGLVTLNPDDYLRYRVSSEAIENSDACFCWGTAQFEMLKSIQASATCEFYITGNPRIDLLRPEFRDIVDKEAQHLRHKYGKFILLNGNFGSYNHVMGLEYTWQMLKSKGWMTNPKDADFHRRRVALQGRFFHAFQDAIPKLCAAGHRVIIRPHPSESLKPWEKLAKDHPGNVLVIYEGNIVPWLQASNLVLHNGCTTAVEAFVLGKPVISYRPEIQPELESQLPNKVSIQATTINELLSLVAEPDTLHEITRKERESFLSNYLVGMSGSTSSERMVMSLPTVRPNEQLTSMYGINRIIGRRLSFLRGQLSQWATKEGKYVKYKCDKLDLDETTSIVHDFSLKLGIKKMPKIEDIGSGLIKITSDSRELRKKNSVHNS